MNMSEKENVKTNEQEKETKKSLGKKQRRQHKLAPNRG
jgi:hypothetical protein